MSKVSFQSVVESVMAFMIAGFLGVLYAYFVSGRNSNVALMRNFVETAFVFFPSIRTGMVMMHCGEGASTFLTLAFFTIVAMAVCGFLGISKKTFVFVLAILDAIYAFKLLFDYDGIIDDAKEEAREEARRENNTYRTYRENTYRASSDSAGKEESYSSGSKRYAGFEYEDEDTSDENEYSYSHSESAESSYGSYYNDYSYYDDDDEYEREYYNCSEDEEDEEDEESEQKESSQQSESSDKSSSDSHNSSGGSGSYTSPHQESDFDKALRVFGLKLPFSSADLKKRRNELVKKNHPDHGGTNEKMIEINKAYELLKRYAS